MITSVYSTSANKTNRGYSKYEEGITLEKVLSCFSRLDGCLYTGIGLVSDKNTQLDVGGGGEWYYVTFFNPGVDCLVLQGPFAEDDSIAPLIVHGNMLYELQRRFHVDREAARHAIVYFFNHGTIDPTMHWHPA